ncbi:MAG: EAL domain-containing protein [Proteobacteria bacterium]|nr:MAG: EAL domain-containing protein [Pseudomonadota bacterium]
MASNLNHLLVVDDDSQICELVQELAEEIGYQARSVSTADEFFGVFSNFAPSVIVLDLNMAGMDGIEHLRFIAENHGSARVLLISGVDQRTLSTAERLGRSVGIDMLGNLHKPFDINELAGILEAAYSSDAISIVSELPEAIEKRQLILHYQPKFRISAADSGALEGVEALVRWRHPVAGMIFPDEFLPAAESSGLMASLTEYVLRESITQQARWSEQGHDLSISVNLPARMVNDARLPDRVFTLLKEFDVSPDRLYLEVTESVAMGNTETAMATLTRLRIRGVGLSIDDFGTGYSSLVQLHRMPFSELKIDKSFVMDCDENADARSIIEIIISLGQKLGLTVCAEGVESYKSWKFLHSLGCERAQGFFMSRPIPADAIGPFANDWAFPAESGS